MNANESFRVIDMTKRLIASFGKINLFEGLFRLEKASQKDSGVIRVRYEKLFAERSSRKGRK